MVGDGSRIKIGLDPYIGNIECIILGPKLRKYLKEMGFRTLSYIRCSVVTLLAQ